MNQEHAIALHYLYDNLIRKHVTIKTTTAVAAGPTDREWTIDDVVQVLVRSSADWQAVLCVESPLRGRRVGFAGGVALHIVVMYIADIFSYCAIGKALLCGIL